MNAGRVSKNNSLWKSRSDFMKKLANCLANDPPTRSETNKHVLIDIDFDTTDAVPEQNAARKICSKR